MIQHDRDDIEPAKVIKSSDGNITANAMEIPGRTRVSNNFNFRDHSVGKEKEPGSGRSRVGTLPRALSGTSSSVLHFLRPLERPL